MADYCRYTCHTCLVVHHHQYVAIFLFLKLPSWIFEMRLLTAITDTFCITVPNFVEIKHNAADIKNFFPFFLMKCKNFSRSLYLVWHNFL